MKVYFIAAALFITPIVGVVAMNPQAAMQSYQDAEAWTKKTFPTPKPKPQNVPRRG